MAHCVASTFEVDLPTRSEMHMAADVAVLPADECLLQVHIPVEQLGLSTILFLVMTIQDVVYLGSMQSSAGSPSTTPYQYHTMNDKL